MKISQQGLDLIAHFEGTRLQTYLDVAGLPTIGVGHLIKPGEDFSGGITEAQAMSLLATDVQGAEDSVSRLVKVPLTQGQFDALTSFVFNLGSGNLASSTLLKKLNAGDYAGAAGQFGVWVNAGGQRRQGLVDRRAAEVVLWNQPDAPAAPATAPDPAPASS